MTAIYDRLKAHTLTKDYQIANRISPYKKFPYIRIGSPLGSRSVMFSSRDTEAEDNVINIHVFSDASHDYEAADIMDNIVQAITSSDIAIAGYSNKYLYIDHAEIFVDDTEPARPIAHGLVRVRCHQTAS